ncbi:MAG: flagellin, partial [Thermoguttaceae bacterium]
MAGMYVASNTTALGAQFNLSRSMSGLTSTLTRLSTGLKINSGKDDPAGLIASELLRA